MPAKIKERWESRPTTLTDVSSVDLEYIIWNTTDDVEAHALLLSTVPTLYGGLGIQKSKIDPNGAGIWIGTVSYETLGHIQRQRLSQPLQVDEEEVSFDTAGGTQHITQSIATVASYSRPGETAPDFKGAIGVTKDSVEGVDLDVAGMKFTVTKKFGEGVVNDEFIQVLQGLTKKTNEASFRGYEIGEVLLDSVQGRRRSGQPVDLTYNFIGCKNVTDVTIGEITGIAKKGHEYLWVRHADEVDTTAKTAVKRPVAVYVEQVRYPGDFSQLGL